MGISSYVFYDDQEIGDQNVSKKRIFLIITAEWLRILFRKVASYNLYKHLDYFACQLKLFLFFGYSIKVFLII